MLGIIELFFPGLFKKENTVVIPVKEPEETKKCKHCLMRIAIFHNSCPHCRGREFIY